MPGTVRCGLLRLATTRGIRALLNAGVRPDAHAAAESTPLLAALRAAHSAEVVRCCSTPVPVRKRPMHRVIRHLMLASASGEAALVTMLLARHARTDAVDQ